MTEFGLLKEAGAVAVTDGNRAVANARTFRRALSYANDFDLPVVQHVEQPTLASGATQSMPNARIKSCSSALRLAATGCLVSRQ